MNPNLPHLMAIAILAGRLMTALLALGAVVSKPLENAFFACLSLAAGWFVIEVGINLWHQHQEAIARRLRDEELKRQRAEEARLRFEAAQREKQQDEDKSYMDLDLDDLPESGEKIPLEALMKKGIQRGTANPAVQGGRASREAASGMSASELDLALIEMDAETQMSSLKRA